jgi:hypothetical protein
VVVIRSVVTAMRVERTLRNFTKAPMAGMTASATTSGWLVSVAMVIDTATPARQARYQPAFSHWEGDPVQIAASSARAESVVWGEGDALSVIVTKMMPLPGGREAIRACRDGLTPRRRRSMMADNMLSLLTFGGLAHKSNDGSEEGGGQQRTHKRRS